MADYKNKCLKEFEDCNIKIGECGYVDKRKFSINRDGTIYCRVTNINGDKISVVINSDDYSKMNPVEISYKEFTRDVRDVGYNPFIEKSFLSRLVKREYSLISILYICGYEKSNKVKRLEKINGIEISDINFNPYVIDKHGNKCYFQRDFVWTLEDKQKFIESIYKNIHCGSVVIRQRSYDYIQKCIENGITEELAFCDIIDGKQRINALLEFVNDKFPDSHGFYYSDLSDRAARKFLDSNVLSFAEMEERSTDKDVLDCFILLNDTGVSIDKKYINKIKDIEI